MRTMPKLHKDLSKAKTPHEQESLKRTIAATDKQMTIWRMGCTGDGR